MGRQQQLFFVADCKVVACFPWLWLNCGHRTPSILIFYTERELLWFTVSNSQNSVSLYQNPTSRHHGLSAGTTEVMKLSNLTLSRVDPGHKPLGTVTSVPLTSTSWPLLRFPHCLLFPHRNGADCVSLTASSALIPQGAPLTMTRLSAPTGSLW